MATENIERWLAEAEQAGLITRVRGKWLWAGDAEDEPIPVPPARAKLREIAARRDEEQPLPTARVLRTLLAEEGFDVARETLQRWIVMDRIPVARQLQRP
jgi:hypothetical protein